MSARDTRHAYAAGVASQRRARLEGWADWMYAVKVTHESGTVAERYDRLRERYVEDKIDLEGFAAEVVKLLLEGL